MAQFSFLLITLPYFTLSLLYPPSITVQKSPFYPGMEQVIQKHNRLSSPSVLLPGTMKFGHLSINDAY